MDQKPNVWSFCTLQTNENTHKHTHTQLHVHQVAAATKPLSLQIPSAQPFLRCLDGVTQGVLSLGEAEKPGDTWRHPSGH